MAKRSADDAGFMGIARKRPRKLSGRSKPPRNSIKCLPLELREEIYRCVLDDLTQEPLHPHSVWPEFGRFQDYLSLLLTDRATSTEVGKVFDREGYWDNVVMYADDTCEIYDFLRALPDCDFTSRIRFKLRAHADWEHEVGFDAVRDESETFMCNQPGLKDEWIEQPGFYSTAPVWSRQSWQPERHGFRSIRSDHSKCSQAECVTHTEMRFPALEGSLRLQSYIWRKQDDDCRVPCSRKLQKGAIMVLSGLLKDLSFRNFRIERARSRLIDFLVHSPTPEMLEKYSYKYPVTDGEFTKMENGWARFWFQDLDEDDMSTREKGNNWPGFVLPFDEQSDSDELDNQDSDGESSLESEDEEGDEDADDDDDEEDDA